MNTFLAILAWCVVLFLCWPIVWLLILPLRLIGVCVHGLFATLTALVTLPARLLGWRPA